MQQIKKSSMLPVMSVMLCGLLLSSLSFAQERRGKTRISNAGFTITALPLLAAKE